MKHIKIFEDWKVKDPLRSKPYKNIAGIKLYYVFAQGNYEEVTLMLAKEEHIYGSENFFTDKEISRLESAFSTIPNTEIEFYKNPQGDVYAFYLSLNNTLDTLMTFMEVSTNGPSAFDL